MRTHSLTEFQHYAAEFAHGIAPRSDRATVIALSGDLGAGKTTFVQTVAREFGIEEKVASPTFVIEKIYELQGKPFKRLIHIDAYRLNDEHELEILGWEEITEDLDNVILIEWPERIPALIPADSIRIRFEINGEERIITVDGGEKES